MDMDTTMEVKIEAEFDNIGMFRFSIIIIIFL